MFQSDYCTVSFIEEDTLVLLTWHKACSGPDYRTPVNYAVELFHTNPACTKLVIDARNGFEDDPADIHWGFNTFLPALSQTSCKEVYFIMDAVSAIEEEMDLWTLEFKKYFAVSRICAYSEALQHPSAEKAPAIVYKRTKCIPTDALAQLFCSVNWASGDYPDKLAYALQNYGCVITAWEGQHLVGLLAAMDDQVMTAYIHYLLVDPAYQNQGIGRNLLHKATAYYQDYLRITLVSVPDQVQFYEKSGFIAKKSNVPMSITALRN